MGWLSAAKGVYDFASSSHEANKAKRDAKVDAQLAQYQAGDALLRGSIEETQYRRHLMQIIGGQKAEFGARNVAATGTALDILGDTAQLGAEDITTIRNNAAREAWGYRVQANEASRYGASQARNLRGQAAGSLLTAGAQAYGYWKDQQT